MGRYISNMQKQEYKKGLELLEVIIGEVKQKNYPIPNNAAFILELERMHEGIRQLLYPCDIDDIFWNSYIAYDRGMILFNYRPQLDVVPIDEKDYLLSKTVVIFNPKATSFYIVTQHAGRKESVYDFKYFNIEKKCSKIFEGIHDADGLQPIFESGEHTSQTLDIVKELVLQISV